MMANCLDEETLASSRQHSRRESHQIGIKARPHNDQINRGSVGFWSSELRAVRLEVFKKWFVTTVILSSFIMAVLSLYWGVLFRVEENLSSLVVWIVDFDGQVPPYSGIEAIVGPMIVEAAESMIAPTGSVGWRALPPSHFSNDPSAVRVAIYNEEAWAAIVINPNATSLLQDAVDNGNSSYDPMGAAQLIYVQARDSSTLGTYVLPQIEELQAIVVASFGKMWVGQVLSRASSNLSVLTNLQAVPQAMNPAIGFSSFNLRPFFPPVATPAVTIGLIYLIIIAFFSFAFFLPIHLRFIKSPGHQPLHFHQLIIWRLIATLTTYLLLSLLYSLISLAFQIPFSANHATSTKVANPATIYAKGTFPVYWMVNYVGMIALGLACENVAMVVGQPWTALWLIFWVITNVSTSFYPITLAPGFYTWGYAWPLHNLVNASRTLLFDVHSKIGLNFGVLLAWAGINIMLFPSCCCFMRWMNKGKEGS